MGRSVDAAPDARPPQHRPGSPVETGCTLIEADLLSPSDAQQLKQHFLTHYAPWLPAISPSPRQPPSCLRQSLPFSASSFTRPLPAHGLHRSLPPPSPLSTPCHFTTPAKSSGRHPARPRCKANGAECRRGSPPPEDLDLIRLWYAICSDETIFTLGAGTIVTHPLPPSLAPPSAPSQALPSAMDLLPTLSSPSNPNGSIAGGTGRDRLIQSAQAVPKTRDSAFLSKLGEWEIEFKTIKAETPHAFHIHFAALEIEYHYLTVIYVTHSLSPSATPSPSLNPPAKQKPRSGTRQPTPSMTYGTSSQPHIALPLSILDTLPTPTSSKHLWPSILLNTAPLSRPRPDLCNGHRRRLRIYAPPFLETADKIGGMSSIRAEAVTQQFSATRHAHIAPSHVPRPIHHNPRSILLPRPFGTSRIIYYTTSSSHLSQLNFLPKMDSNPKKRAMDRLIPESLTRNLRKTDLPSEPLGDVSSSASTAAIVSQQPLEPVTATSNSNEGAVPNSTSTTPNNRPEGGARKRNIAKAAIKETLRTIVNVTDVFPPLKSVAAGILEIIERYDAVHDVQRGFTELQKQLEGLLAVIRLYQDDVPVNVMNALSGLARAIEEKKTVLEKKLEESVPVRGMSAPADIAFMTETMRNVNFAIQVVMMDISLATHIETSSISNKISDIHSDVYLGKLGRVTGANFNHEDRQGCMQGTRVLLLAELWGWSMDLSAPHVFWLSGIAGTGKTTVLETLCRMLDKEGLLGGSFFCSRKSKERATLQNIFPSLAQTMARTSTGFREGLMKVLQHRECADPPGMNLADQYKLLILEPAKATFEKYTASTVLAIDALDECDDPVATEKLLNVILTSRPVEYLKIIVTSRPEPPIRSAFQSKHHSGLRLHEIEDHIVEADIMMYLTHRLMEIPQLRNEYANTPWPPQEVTILTKRAGGLFIYVSTICAYIGNYKGSPTERLKKLCSLTTPPTLAVAGIDNIYTFILSEAFSNIDPDEKACIQACLSLLVSATQPLQVIGYARLLNTSPQLVRAAVHSLHSVIHVPEKDADGEIIPYHASFPDYLTTESRAGSHEWFIKLHSAHSSSADQCFAIMEMELHFGIGGATKIYKNSKGAGTTVHIPSYLAYVCTAWAHHVL
ncbi:hypothetical protein M422DRAFT_265020, partial [Sphaerobolus stellatus SS14]